MSLSIGAQAPDFELPDTDGTTHSPDGTPATVNRFSTTRTPSCSPGSRTSAATTT